MVSIKKGNNILKVSKETFKSMFERMGYVIVDEEGASKVASSENIKNIKNTKPKNSNKNEKSDVFSKDLSNSSLKSEKSVETNSKSKENDLDNILGMLSKNEEINKKK